MNLQSLFPRATSQVWKARRLRSLASGFSQAGDEERARGLRRKALRCLDPNASDPAWTAEPDLRRIAEDLRAAQISRALDRRLAAAGPRRWVAQRWRPIVLGAGGAVLVFVLLVVAVSPVRRAVFPPDLADGKRWSASSAMIAWPSTGLLHGDAGDGCCFFHTKEELSPSVTVDLGKIMPVRRVDIGNRSECCTDRALPLAVEVSQDGSTWTRVAYLRGDFKNTTARFPKVNARFVRLRVDRTSYLHLYRIAVY